MHALGKIQLIVGLHRILKQIRQTQDSQQKLLHVLKIYHTIASSIHLFREDPAFLTWLTANTQLVEDWFRNQDDVPIGQKIELTVLLRQCDHQDHT